MLHELDQGEFHRVLPLFRGYLQDPMMHAVVEGRSRGRVFVDDAVVPGAALVCTGAECAYVVGGQGSSQFNEALRQLVLEEIIPAARAGGLSGPGRAFFGRDHGRRALVLGRRSAPRSAEPASTRARELALLDHQPAGARALVRARRPLGRDRTLAVRAGPRAPGGRRYRDLGAWPTDVG